jgi:protein-tyrosine phosphatase
MEIGISENLPELVSSGRILTLGHSNCLLLEIPFISLPLGIEEIILNLKTIGVITMLAHPERNKEIQGNPKRVLDLVKAGASVQITAGSCCGYFGERAMRCVLELAKFGVIHAVASDAHDVDKRPPNVTEGLKVLEELMGAQQIELLLANSYSFIEKESRFFEK